MEKYKNASKKQRQKQSKNTGRVDWYLALIILSVQSEEPPEVFYKKGFLKNFAKFIGKKYSGTGLFLWTERNFVRAPTLQNISGRLVPYSTLHFGCSVKM